MNTYRQENNVTHPVDGEENTSIREYNILHSWFSSIHNSRKLRVLKTILRMFRFIGPSSLASIRIFLFTASLAENYWLHVT